MYELIDVSMWMDAFTFPGDRPLAVRGPVNVLDSANPEYVYEFTSSTQTGTHVQGPHYFLEHGTRVDALPLARFEGPAHLVDVTRRGEDTSAEELAAVLGDRDVQGQVVLLRSGHMEEVIATGELDPRTRPGLSMDAARYLAEEKRIGMVAIDSVGVESRRTRDFDVNVYLCRRGVLILEGLVNLHAVTGRELWLEAFPLKMRGVEGTPCRAIVKQSVSRSPPEKG